MAEVFVIVTHDNRFVGVHATERDAQREAEWLGRNLHVSREEMEVEDASSLSLSQIDWLKGVIEVARSRVGTLFDEHETEAALAALRSELTKEDGC